MFESITDPIFGYFSGEDDRAAAYQDARDAVEWLRRDGLGADTIARYSSAIQAAYDADSSDGTRELQRLTAEIRALSASVGGAQDRPPPFVIYQPGSLEPVPTWVWVAGGVAVAVLVIPWLLNQAVKVKELRR